MKREVVALVEIGGSHDECLLTQFSALKKDGHSIVFVTTKELFDRNPHFKGYYKEVLIINLSIAKWKRRGELKKILHFFKQHGVSKAVFNTAQGGNIRRLCMMSLFNKIEFIGVLHTLRMLEVSSTQKVIHKKIKKYFFLSEYLCSKAIAPKGIQLSYFYPIHFLSQHKRIDRNEYTPLRITIIGGVENRRKDLEGFVQMIKTVNEHVHFTFLGKSNPQDEEVVVFKQQLAAINKLNQVTFYDSFVEHEAFDDKLAATDAILPLVHPGTRSSEQYFTNQISGATTVAFGYKIPLLIHESYTSITELKIASLYYTLENFSQQLNEIETELKAVRSRMVNEPSLQTEVQEERFLKLVFS